MDLRERPSIVTARHPWETVHAALFCRVLRDPLGVGRPVAVLDAGAGDGLVGGWFANERRALNVVDYRCNRLLH